MSALSEYLDARELQAEAEAHARSCRRRSDAALLHLSETLATGSRSAGRGKLAELTGEGESALGQRLRRARTGDSRQSIKGR